MNISNFHTHTYLCKHAIGTAEEYILQAAKSGCSELGISDHCPYPPEMFDNWDGCRMIPENVSEYRESVFSGAQKVPFKVHLGFECEYDREYKSWYSDVLKGEFGAEYLVLGPHWVKDGKKHIYIKEINHSKELLFKYAEQTIEAIQSGLYAFVAHPDLFMSAWIEWDEEAKSVLKDILNAAIDAKLPVEVNGLGIYRGIMPTSRGDRYGYPYLEFWQVVASSGAKVICNSDAHEPSHVIENAKVARKFASELGMTPIETIF